MNSKRTFLTGLIGAGVAIGLGRQAVAQQAATYTYDVHGRLIGVNRSGAQTSYTYDAANNRTGRGPGAPPPPPPPPPGPLTAVLSATQWYEGDVVGCSASGGTPPYSYQWQRVSGQIGFSATNPTGSATAWINNGDPPEFTPIHAQWRCRVTDSTSMVADTGQVRVTFAP